MDLIEVCPHKVKMTTHLCFQQSSRDRTWLDYMLSYLYRGSGIRTDSSMTRGPLCYTAAALIELHVHSVVTGAFELLMARLRVLTGASQDLDVSARSTNDGRAPPGSRGADSRTGQTVLAVRADQEGARTSESEELFDRSGRFDEDATTMVRRFKKIRQETIGMTRMEIGPIFQIAREQ